MSASGNLRAALELLRGRRVTLLIMGAAMLAALLAGALVGTQSARSADTSPLSVTISGAQPVYLVQNGDTAQVGVELTTTGSQPLDRDVTVSYQTGGTLTVGNGSAAKTLPSTAVAGTDYTSASGSITFPAGTASGTTKTFPVTTLHRAAASEAKTINVTLSTTDTSSTVSGPPTVVINAHGLPYLNKSLPISQRVNDLLSRMTLAEKVGQMTQADRSMFTDQSASSNNSIDDIRAWLLGSTLSGAGDTPTPNTPTGWADMVDSFEDQALATPLQIPLIYGEDTVHGDGNMIGATVFPHNIGMGATRDPALARQEGAVTAAETRATGPQWGFAPCICVARDDRWGRTYESFGESPKLVERMESVINGFQGNHPEAKYSGGSSLNSDSNILSTAKHFAGDGGTTYGTGDSGYPIDQGVDIMSSSKFRKLFLAPYLPAVQKHQVGSIMPSYSSVQLDGAACPTKMSADKRLLTNVLKDQIGFNGFLISDYNAINEIGDSRSCPIPSPLPAGVADTYSYQIEVSANAGMDMFMVPNAYQTLESDLNTLVQNGVVAMSRVNDAVRRILTQKFELGLFERPFTNRSHVNQVGDAAHRAVAAQAAARQRAVNPGGQHRDIGVGGVVDVACGEHVRPWREGDDAHRAVAAQAAAESQVLLKNAGHVLPLKSTEKIYVAGSNADNLGSQTGGWTLQWQGAPGAIDDPGTTILQGIQAKDSKVSYSQTASAPTSGYKVGVVVVGEHPYAEGEGDVGQTGYAQNGDIANLDLTAADHQAVDTVCHAMPCVVLVVSGRPMTITDQLKEIDGLVASWLPGTEGEGVADALFGAIPFQGQLPQSWPRTLSQEPINVGDHPYNPLFPFGWGLRTTTAHAEAQAARSLLAGDGAAYSHITALVRNSQDWYPNGRARRPAAVLIALRTIAGEVAGAPFNEQEAVLTVARDIVQRAIVAAGGPTASNSPLVANADNALLAGRPGQAAQLLSEAFAQA